MANRRFDAFVLFAEMRTGSNHLEASLDALPDLSCYGEIYNPTFIGSHNQFELFGYDMDRREADPLGFLDTVMAETEGLPGFRLFHDHNDQVVSRVLPDPRIAKVILTRNPLESYVSKKIAEVTGQWRLTDGRKRRGAQIRFAPDEFRALIERLQAFQLRLQKGLQSTGQTAFYLRYEDITDGDVLNGLARFLGSEHDVAASKKLKKQNPGDLSEKVENYDEMLSALSGFDRFETGQTPNFEPPRHAGVPGFVAHPEAGLLFMPIKGAPEDTVLDWMGRIGGVGPGALLRGMSQKDLRQWMKAHPGFRSFTVLRHPVDRAYSVFNRFILPHKGTPYADLRNTLRKRYKVPLPRQAVPENYDLAAHKAAFLAFLEILKSNLAGQTSLRVDPAWATQTAILQGIANVTVPHRLLPEGDLATMLPSLAFEAGVGEVPDLIHEEPQAPFDLAQVYDREIEKAAHAAYRRDYLNFGFVAWGAG